MSSGQRLINSLSTSVFRPWRLRLQSLFRLAATTVRFLDLPPGAASALVLNRYALTDEALYQFWWYLTFGFRNIGQEIPELK